MDRACPKAAEVVVLVAAGVVAGGPGTADRRQTRGRPHLDQCLKGFVDGCQTDFGHGRADGVKHLFSRGMVVGSGQLVVDGQPLRRASQPGGFQTVAKPIPIQRGEHHRAI